MSISQVKIRVLCFTLWLIALLCLSVSSYATKTTLDYFTANQAPYLNADSGGATGTYSWVSSGGYSSGGALKIQYSFPNSAGYSVWREIPSPTLSTSVTGVSFMVKDASGAECYVQVIDSTGQCHCFSYNINGPVWQNIQVPLQGSNTKSHYGGANDGIIHTPVSEIDIGACKRNNTSGTMYLDQVYAYTNIDVLDNFSTNQAPYSVTNGNEYPPGATSTYSWLSSGGVNSGGALQIQYAFPPGSAYTQWIYTPSPALTGNESSISFWVKDSVGNQCMVRLIDSTGQVLQYEFPFTSTNWQNIQVPLIGGASTQFYDGANDGVVHPPVSAIQIGATEPGYMGANTTSDSCGVMCISDLCAYNGNEAVNIDLSSDKGAATYRAAGTQQFNSNTSAPPNSMVTPLKLQTCRGFINAFPGQGLFPAAARLTGLGMRMQVMLDGEFATPPFPGDIDSTGNANWTAWDDWVNTALTTALTTYGQYKFEWDIWNEPDGTWTPSVAQSYQMWLTTCNMIRSAYQSYGKTATIIGPTYGWFDETGIQNFLLFCQANNCLPDILNWHEGGIPWMADYKLIPNHVALIRSWMSANGINIPRVGTNEMVPWLYQNDPGPNLWYVAMGEQAQLDMGCKTCNSDQLPGNDNCNNDSLVGRLDYNTKQPKSEWYTYQGYANVTGRLLSATSNGASVVAIAGADPSADAVNVVLGRDLPEGNHIVLNNFAVSQTSYSQTDSGGATATYSWADTDWNFPYDGGGDLSIAYQFPTGSIYSAFAINTSALLNGNETYLTFWVEDTVGSQCLVQMVDATGQTHQWVLPSSVNYWSQISVQMLGGTDQSHWGGANDGVIHTPVSEIYIGPYNGGFSSGTMYIDEIDACYNNSGVDVIFNNINSLAFLAGATTVNVVATPIQDSGWNPVSAPSPSINATYPVINNSVLVTLPTFGDRDAYTIQLTK